MTQLTTEGLSLLPSLMRAPHISSMHHMVATFGSCSPLVGEQEFSVSQPFELRSIPFGRCWRTAPRYKCPHLPANRRPSSPIPARSGGSCCAPSRRRSRTTIPRHGPGEDVLRAHAATQIPVAGKPASDAPLPTRVLPASASPRRPAPSPLRTSVDDAQVRSVAQFGCMRSRWYCEGSVRYGPGFRRCTRRLGSEGTPSHGVSSWLSLDARNRTPGCIASICNMHGDD